MPTDLEDRLTIRNLVDNWVVYRDAGMWEKFRTVWHDDGTMQATWAQGSVDEFIERSKAAWEKGLNVLHFLGGNTVELSGDRAISQTKMTITQRALVHDVLVDVVCTGRFYDFFERREGRWGMVFRQPIYEADRMNPVNPLAQLELDPGRLSRFPEGYCHLAYLQSLNGMDVKTDMPGLRGPEVDELYGKGRALLDGSDSPF